MSSVYFGEFGRKPNRKRVCGSLNRTSQNHYGSEQNRTGVILTSPGSVWFGLVRNRSYDAAVIRNYRDNNTYSHNFFYINRRHIEPK